MKNEKNDIYFQEQEQKIESEVARYIEQKIKKEASKFGFGYAHIENITTPKTTKSELEKELDDYNKIKDSHENNKSNSSDYEKETDIYDIVFDTDLEREI